MGWWAKDERQNRRDPNVLILVLVDDGLVVRNSLRLGETKQVLILVLVDDGLVA